MKNHFGALALVVLLSLYFVAALGAVPAAHALTVVTVDSTFCSGKGTWDSTFLICALTTDYAVPSGDNLELICGTGPRGTSLHIGSGTTLTIPSGAALTIPAGVPCGDVQALLGGTLTVDAGAQSTSSTTRARAMP